MGIIRAAIPAVAAILVLAFPGSSFAVKSGETVTWPGGGAGQVEFEGEEHAEEGYKCSDCHPAIFMMKKGAARLTMSAMNKGQFCGACHNGATAFSTSNADKCHECHKQGKKHHKKQKHEHDERKQH